MTTSTRRLFSALAVLVVIGLLALAALALWPTHTRSIASLSNDAPDSQLVERGRYLAMAGDCIACHTAKTADAKPFSGGLAVASPIGNIYSTNITPDKDTGIGNYSLDDFERALRHGITPAGGTLYPAMPYPSYARLTDEDVAAMYAFFMHGVEPAHEENRKADIKWPLSMRWPLTIWRRLYGPEVAQGGFDAGRYDDPQVARGAYLVQGLGHCGACHTPRAVTLQEKGMDDFSDLYLAGGPVIDGWVAVNLRGNHADGLGNWSKEDIIATLRGARNPHGAVVGSPMHDVVIHSTQGMSDEDLQAVASYLKTLKPAAATPSSYTASDDTAKALTTGQDIGRGGALYADNCAACHRSNGKGNVHAFPPIAGNPSVLAENPASLIRLVLTGSMLPSTKAAPSNLGMPGFAWRLSDGEVAELVSFIRNGWGNKASTVNAAQVAGVRKALDEEKEAAEKHAAR